MQMATTGAGENKPVEETPGKATPEITGAGDAAAIAEAEIMAMAKKAGAQQEFELLLDDDDPKKRRSVGPGGRINPKNPGPLQAIMMLDEPRRTDLMEKAANSGLAFSLKTKDGKERSVCYGRVILKVSGTPKPYIFAHAAHLLWKLGDQLVELREA